MRVAIYIRVSTKMQVDRYSLEDQERTCRAYAAQRGWQVAGVYVDKAVSGRRDDRPELARLKQDARMRRFDVVLVFKLNRFARNVPAQYQVAAEFEQLGVEIASATEPFERKTAAGKLTFGMLAVIAQFDSDQQSERVASAKRMQAESGHWVGPVPYGYEKAGKTIRPKQDADAEAGRLIFHLYKTGDWSDRTLADELNIRGYRTYDPQTKQRGYFGRESVRAILKNPAYIGIVRCGGKEYPGIHEPLIDRDIWARCQALRGERDRGGRGHTNGDGWLLSRIVRCAACGETMWTHPSGRQGHLRYYYCAGRDHRTCTAPLIRAEPVEAQALEMVKALALPGAWQAAIMHQIAALLQPTPSKPAISKETIEAQLKRLALVYAAGDIDEATYQRQRAAWRKQLEVTGAPILLSAYNPRRAFEVLGNLANLLDGAKEAQQRSVLRHIFATLWLAPHRVAAITPTDLYAPMLAAVETLRGKDGDMGCPTGFEPATS